MALSIIKEPYNGEPLNGMDNSTIYLVVESDLSYYENFNYSIQTIVNWPVGYPSYFYKVPPRPVTGYLGQFAASDILKSFCTYNLNQNITSITGALNSWVNYSFNITETFNPNITYYDAIYYSGYVGLTGLGVSGLFHAGDTITIQGDNPILAPEYNGTWQIISTSYDNPDLDNATVILDLPFTISTPEGSGGLITYCSLDSQAISTSNKIAFNSTRQYGDLQTTNSSLNYLIENTSTTGGRLLLTPWNSLDFGSPNSTNEYLLKSIFPLQRETLSFNIATSSNVLGVRYTTYDENFNIIASIDKYVPSGGSSVYKSYDIPAGPGNITGISWTGVSYYKIYLWNSSTGWVLSRSYGYKIVDNCSPYPNVRIMFMNRFGRFSYFNFNYVSKNTFDVSDRQEFRKTLPWNYTIGMRGDTVLSQQVQSNFYLSTDWITEYESSILKELAYSPEVYIIDEVSGNALPVIITDTQYEVKTALKDRLFCMTLNVKMAYNTTTQNQ